MATIACADAITGAAPERADPTTNRIETLDFVRGCALFGILLMNITAFGIAPLEVHGGHHVLAGCVGGFGRQQGGQGCDGHAAHDALGVRGATLENIRAGE